MGCPLMVDTGVSLSLFLTLQVVPYHTPAPCGACHWTEELMSHIIRAALFVPGPLDSVPWGQSALALDKALAWHCAGHSGVTKSPWVTLSHKFTVSISNLVFPVLLSPCALFQNNRRLLAQNSLWVSHLTGPGTPGLNSLLLSLSLSEFTLE